MTRTVLCRKHKQELPGLDPVQRLIEQHGVDPGLGPEGEQALGDAVEGGGGAHSGS